MRPADLLRAPRYSPSVWDLLLVCACAALIGAALSAGLRRAAPCGCGCPSCPCPAAQERHEEPPRG